METGKNWGRLRGSGPLEGDGGDGSVPAVGVECRGGGGDGVEGGLGALLSKVKVPGQGVSSSPPRRSVTKIGHGIVSSQTNGSTSSPRMGGAGILLFLGCSSLPFLGCSSRLRREGLPFVAGTFTQAAIAMVMNVGYARLGRAQTDPLHGTLIQ